MNVAGYSRIVEMLRLAGSNERLFPATLLYNEGWLLRLVLDWFANRKASEGHVLSFHPGARWFSEALLPSQFFASSRGDALAEGWTHADGVVGHVAIGSAALADTRLNQDAEQFVVTEAKLFSPLSAGVRNASYYDQAARNVACMAEILCRAGRRPENLRSLAFLVLAPRSQIELGVLEGLLAKDSIRAKVARRIGEYEPERQAVKKLWMEEWFLPTLEHAQVRALSWEDILEHVERIDGLYAAAELKGFYARCLEFNRLQEQE